MLLFFRSSSPDLGSTHAVNTFGSRLDHFETSYVEYLEYARQRITECGEACQCWSAAYDGDDPLPEPPTLPETPSTDETVSPMQERLPALPSPTNTNFQSPLSSTPKKTEDSSPELTQSPQDSGVCVKSEGSDPNSDKTESAASSPHKDSLVIESHGQSPSLELSMLSDGSDGEAKVSPRSPPGELSKSPRSDDSKLPIIPESSRVNNVARDSYAESVTSEADSALSGSSCATDNAGGSGDTAGSRSDSPLNDNFQAQEFAAFLMNLKRVKTPVEFCDNIEDSLSEMDTLINDLRHISPPSSRERVSSLPKSSDTLPQFTASHNGSVVRPCANRDIPSTCDSKSMEPLHVHTDLTHSSSPPVGSPGTLEDRLTEFESDRSIKRTLETLPRRSSSISDTESRSGSVSAFSPPKGNLTAHRYSFGSPNIGKDSLQVWLKQKARVTPVNW